MLREVGQGLESALLGGLLGDGEGVGVLRLAVRKDLEAAWQRDGEGILHGALLRGRGLRVEVVQQRALALGQQIDVAALERGDEDLAGAQVGADLGRHPGRFEGGRVEGIRGPWVRAVLAVRANQLRAGGAGLRPTVVTALCEALETGAYPQVNAFGSVGTGDIAALAQMGLALAGEHPWQGHGTAPEA